MASRNPRIFRYEVDEVWGDDPPVKVGDVLVDRWRSDRTWQLYKVPEMEPTSGWHARCLGEVEPEVATKVHARWAQQAVPR